MEKTQENPAARLVHCQSGIGEFAPYHPFSMLDRGQVGEVVVADPADEGYVAYGVVTRPLLRMSDPQYYEQDLTALLIRLRFLVNVDATVDVPFRPDHRFCTLDHHTLRIVRDLLKMREVPNVCLVSRATNGRETDGPFQACYALVPQAREGGAL